MQRENKLVERCVLNTDNLNDRNHLEELIKQVRNWLWKRKHTERGHGKRQNETRRKNKINEQLNLKLVSPHLLVLGKAFLEM